MSSTQTETEARRPGRPRSARADAAIAQATFELLMEHGFTDLSVEAVAERAGVSKATIYRRAASKAELVIQAIESTGIGPPPELPDTGNIRDDLVALGRVQGQEAKEAGVPVLTFPRVLAEAALSDPELHRVLKKGLMEPRTSLVERLVRRGIERGELRSDLDVELVVSMMFGALVFIGLRNGRGWTEEPRALERVVDTLLAGIAAR
jgi:AcrR family transcriptional regulator